MRMLKSVLTGFVSLFVIVILLLLIINLAGDLGGTGVFWVVVLGVLAILVVRKGNKKDNKVIKWLAEPSGHRGTQSPREAESRNVPRDVPSGPPPPMRRQPTRDEELRAQLLHISSRSGTEFEHYIAKVFRLLGYNATVLGGAGDQGVDLLLRKGGEVVAVQCKNYQRPVGNKPVQEVFAGKHHHKTNAAWVVAPAGFTEGAVTLARSTGVRLFDRGGITRLLQKAEEQRAEEEQAESARVQEHQQRHLGQQEREQELQRQNYERSLEAYSDQVRYLEHYITSRELRYLQGFGSDADERHRHKLTMHDLDYSLEIAHRDLERLQQRNPNLAAGELFEQYAALKHKEQEIRERQKKLEAS